MEGLDGEPAPCRIRLLGAIEAKLGNARELEQEMLPNARKIVEAVRQVTYN